MFTHALTKALALRSTGTVTALCAPVGMCFSLEDRGPSQHIACKPANLEGNA